MCRRTEEEIGPTVGLPRHRHFVGFFNVPVLAPTGPTFLYGDSDTPPHLVAFYDHAGDTEVHILDLTPPPPGPQGGTINDIAVINMYVTAHRCAGGLKKFDLLSGSQRHRHFVWFFNVPVQAPTRGHPYGYSEKPPHLVAFYDTLGIRRTYSRLKPSCPHGGPDNKSENHSRAEQSFWFRRYTSIHRKIMTINYH